MMIVQYVIISIFFLLELATLASWMYWGFHLDKNLLIKIVLGIGMPLLIAIFWGTFIAPKASIPVSVPLRIILQVIIFGSAATVLYFSDKRMLALIFAVVALVEMILMYSMKL